MVAKNTHKIFVSTNFNVCYWCGSPNHFKKECPKLKRKGGYKARQLLVQLMEEFETQDQNEIESEKLKSRD